MAENGTSGFRGRGFPRGGGFIRGRGGPRTDRGGRGGFVPRGAPRGAPRGTFRGPPRGTGFVPRGGRGVPYNGVNNPARDAVVNERRGLLPEGSTPPRGRGGVSRPYIPRGGQGGRGSFTPRGRGVPATNGSSAPRSDPYHYYGNNTATPANAHSGASRYEPRSYPSEPRSASHYTPAEDRYAKPSYDGYPSTDRYAHATPPQRSAYSPPREHYAASRSDPYQSSYGSSAYPSSKREYEFEPRGRPSYESAGGYGSSSREGGPYGASSHYDRAAGGGDSYGGYGSASGAYGGRSENRYEYQPTYGGTGGSGGRYGAGYSAPRGGPGGARRF